MPNGNARVALLAVVVVVAEPQRDGTADVVHHDVREGHVLHGAVAADLELDAAAVGVVDDAVRDRHVADSAAVRPPERIAAQRVLITQFVITMSGPGTRRTCSESRCSRLRRAGCSRRWSRCRSHQVDAVVVAVGAIEDRNALDADLVARAGNVRTTRRRSAASARSMNSCRHRTNRSSMGARRLPRPVRSAGKTGPGRRSCRAR